MTNKLAAACIIVLGVMMAVFIGVKIDQTTIALLSGAFIGLIVAIPTTALILIIGLKPSDKNQVQTPPATPETHTHYHNHTVFYVQVPRPIDSYTPFQICGEVATRMKVSRHRAQELIDSGEVKLIEAPKGEA